MKLVPHKLDENELEYRRVTKERKEEEKKLLEHLYTFHKVAKDFGLVEKLTEKQEQVYGRMIDNLTLNF